MSVAALYDIHANLPALEAVLRELQQAGVEQIVVGGDVLPGPMPIETIERLRALAIPAQYIEGNGDRDVLAGWRGAKSEKLPEWAVEGIRWNARQLTLKHVIWVASWPMTTNFQ